MKRILLTLVWTIGLGVLFQVQAQESQRLDDLKAREQALNLNTKLVKLKIDLEEEKARNADYQTDADSYNYKSNLGSANYDSSNAEMSAKAAKESAKMLKKTQKANDKLKRSNGKIADLEAEIFKCQSKVDRLEKKVRFVEP